MQCIKISYLFFCLGATINSAQSLLLAVCLEITPDSLWGGVIESDRVNLGQPWLRQESYLLYSWSGSLNKNFDINFYYFCGWWMSQGAFTYQVYWVLLFFLPSQDFQHFLQKQANFTRIYPYSILYVLT